ncbi:nucleotidyltransferase family protein [Neobacillus sp. NPDC093127]|uniref:nucleotidyltransferase family protein n=1 Tax=Neobacillus sp. NPDC093127 TaxID=3364296 RepID=UPI0038212A63
MKNFLQVKYGIIKLGIFGSYARNEQKATSDVDVLIESQKGNWLCILKLATQYS